MGGAQTTNNWSNLQHLVPVGTPDLKANHDVQRFRPGTVAFMTDDFGFKAFKYVKVTQSGGMTVGQLASRLDPEDIDNASAGTTTQITTSGRTADADIGKLLHCYDNASGAGAAPEGEIGVVVDNSTTVIKIDAARPFTVAAAASDDFRLISVFHVGDSASGDLTTEVEGPIASPDGITVNYFGWVQIFGICPKTAITTAAITDEEAVIASTAAVVGTPGVAAELQIGKCVGSAAADQVNLFAPIYINTLFNGTLVTT